MCIYNRRRVHSAGTRANMVDCAPLPPNTIDFCLDDAFLSARHFQFQRRANIFPCNHFMGFIFYWFTWIFFIRMTCDFTGGHISKSNYLFMPYVWTLCLAQCCGRFRIALSYNDCRLIPEKNGNKFIWFFTYCIDNEGKITKIFSFFVSQISNKPLALSWPQEEGVM